MTKKYENIYNNDKNVLYEDMVEEKYTTDGEILEIERLKKGDVIKLKDDKYAEIISDGEYCNDVDYGEMYKNIKRFKYIDQNIYHILRLKKQRDEHEDKILKHKKEKYRLDLLIYLTENRILLSNKCDSVLYNEFRQSKILCNIEDIGVFYKTNEGIKQMITAGYNTSFYKVNISEQILLKISKDFIKVNSATISTDILNFDESVK